MGEPSRTPAADRVCFAQGLRGIAAMLLYVTTCSSSSGSRNGVSASLRHMEPLDRTIDATHYDAAVILADMRVSLGLLG